MDESYVKKFWEKAIVQEGCWGWSDKPFANGYPYLQVGRKGKKQKASRISFFAHFGYLPSVVRHTCDNPVCTNPEHLLPGTQAENVADRRERGRARNQNTNKQVCRRGHDPDWKYVWNKTKNAMSRQCRECLCIRSAEYRRRKKGGGADEDEA